MAPCLDCDSSSNCLSCSGANRSTPECDCDVGYFENDSGECERCDDICTECTASGSCT